MMNISLLASYVVFARRLNFTEAAKELCMTQPTLSKQIATIEKEVGCQLVDRSKQQLALTHAGTIYLEGASAVLIRYEKTLTEISALSKKDIDYLAVSGLIYSPAMTVIQSFREKNPLIHLKIDSKSIPGEVDALLEKEADVCLGIYFPQLASPGVLFTVLCTMPLCIIVNENHRFAGREKIHVTELKDETIITRSEDSVSLQQGFANLFAAHGFSPNYDLRYPSSFPELLTDLRGSVLLWISGLDLPGAKGLRLSTIEVEGEDFECEYGAWYREDSSNPALPLFLKELAL